VGKDETDQREYDRLFDDLNTNYGMAGFASITERGRNDSGCRQRMTL
jgi:hypothetical protein